MKTTTKNTSAVLVGLGCAALSFATGCSGTLRSPDLYRDDTAKMLQGASDGITTCYNQVLTTNPTASGSVTVHFLVAPKTGKVRRIHVDESRSTAPAPVQECVKHYIVDLHLEPADDQIGDAMFTWDFTYKTAEPAPAAAEPAADAPKPAT